MTMTPRAKHNLKILAVGAAMAWALIAWLTPPWYAQCALAAAAFLLVNAGVSRPK